ncbi:molybdate ABC transporter substrate-binding protein [Nostoc punctiforme]|uniref:Molybdenum ABC transporter, periplasmic molybdate-binding protein n=1 Tax=Nostoc punctiforme (strain ATCC 29133 / PCC 73102) TaxID=63737 RepID=B2J3H8_NOSP7|nr:molybdate ABC transporter substrate-binding protein [Nostoc punctiforme]ACC78908.1 molybdenum ABC transporter, periplasmic molybdate-binding protein [Nostoc punctiforme PCC 73102]
MKKHFFAFSLIACAVSVIPTKALAVNLYGAGSLRDSLTEVAESFSEKYGIPVETRFGPSGLTREFIEQEFSKTGKSADVFASADVDNPQTLFQEGLSEPVVNFTSNRMVAVVRSGLGITSNNLLNFLLKPEIKLGTSTPIADPSGNYAWQIFDKSDQITPGNSQILKNKALQLVGGNPNAPIVPNGKNNLVYFLEETKQADIFLAYYTSGKTAQVTAGGENLQIVELPDYLATKANYGLTTLKNADPDGEKLAEYILSPEGQEILTKYGFSSPSTSVPEHQGAGGVLLALGLALILNTKQRIKSESRS